MRSTRLAIGLLVLVALALSVSGLASAANVTLAPAQTHIEYAEVEDGDWIDYTWTAGGSVSFVLTDPDGIIQDTSTSTTDFGLFVAEMDGTYVLTWTNTGLSSYTLNYELNVSPLGGGEGLFEDIVTTLIIVAVVIVVIVVVIIVLVVFVLGKDKKKAQAQNAAMPMMAPPPGVTLTNCPRCGMPLDPQGAFCQKCGARVR